MSSSSQNIRIIYKVLRSVILTLVLSLVGIYLILYVALSIPAVQNLIRGKAESFVSDFLESHVVIDNIQIVPFTQVVVSGLHVDTPKGERMLDVETVGAGINIWKLIFKQEIELSYAELIGMKGKIWQETNDAPLNIDFIIKAFAPKDKTKPPTQFDLAIRTIVIRKSSVTFDKRWVPRNSNSKKIDFNHLKITDLKADVSLPVLKNDCFDIDLRRLSLKEQSGLVVESISGRALITPHAMKLSALHISLPHTQLTPDDIELKYPELAKIGDEVKNGNNHLSFYQNKITLSDFSSFVPELKYFADPIFLSLDATGNADNIALSLLKITTPDDRLDLNLEGTLSSLSRMENLRVALPVLSLKITGTEVKHITEAFAKLGEGARYIENCGNIELDAKTDLTFNSLDFKGNVNTSLGDLIVDTAMKFGKNKGISINGKINTPDIDLGALLGNQDFGSVALDSDVNIEIIGKSIEGTILAEIPYFEYGGHRWNEIYADIIKEKDSIEGVFSVNDVDCDLKISGGAIIAGQDSRYQGTAEIGNINFSALSFIPKLNGYTLHGEIDIDASGNSIDNLEGELTLSDLVIGTATKGNLPLGNITVTSHTDYTTEIKHVYITSDYLDATMSGSFRFTHLPLLVKNMLAVPFPSLISASPLKALDEYVKFNATIKENNQLPEFFNLPLRLLTNITISGVIDQAAAASSLVLDCPYLQQGKNKLIRDTSLGLAIDNNLDLCALNFTSVLPSKDSDVTLNINATGENDQLNTDIGWRFDKKGDFSGKLLLSTIFEKDRDSSLNVLTKVKPSHFTVNDSVWTINQSTVEYSDKKLEIHDLKVGRNDQFVKIEGTASSLSSDLLKIALQDIDLDFIFETLNINYVTFGGRATGEVTARELFSRAPKALLPALKVQGLTYNGALLGDAMIRGEWINSDKHVSIFANIFNGIHKAATVDGGVWVTADSLNFKFDADKVNCKFLQPFMQAFSSDVEGRASGHANLYGNFSDIDLVGDLFADTIRMKVDYTNTWYAGSDSVHLRPGRIDIPNFTIYDKEGHSAKLTGWVTHRYFHEPSFEFRLTDAHDFLCYDTNSMLNPDWYGTIYGNGGGLIRGFPGRVDINIDMTTAANSSFTFVLSDLEAAENYEFLTFSDRKAEAERAALPDTVPDILKQFRRKVAQSAETLPSTFEMNLRVTVTPDAKLTLIMDPITGDKIRAEGNGAMQIGYKSENDEMSIYGKYILDKGSYNFTLQDIIIKDFQIREGSNITFTGDPFNAQLDITAAYRVNANLTDLDKSFATERDLNRTNVPVDALLMVSGELTHPEITFDIALPTLTEDVTRKVKSIISTDDMLSRQIVYLLALNRFYTPEYMGTSGNNNELASMASSTISSGITNVLGALSDKWSFAPNIRTDKGDFSDTEFDLALSSSLLNNRLLLNGNFGYRDRSNSSTTFVGDFDIEYLLNRRGTFRLKAYNHFNDENYYLKSALTTQGVGILYKHDFDSWFSFMRKGKKNKNESVNAKIDSLESNAH